MASQRGPSTSAADPESQPFIDNTIDQDEPSPDNDFLQKAGRIELSELKRPAIFFGSIFAVIVAALLFDKAFIAGFFKAPLPDVRALSEDVFAEGMNACGRIQRVKELNPSAYFTGGPPANLAQRRNPRYPVLVNNTKAVSSGNPILIKDATVLDGIGGRFENVDVALANGLIVQIGKDLSTLDVIKAAQRGADAWNVKMSFAVDDVLVIKADGRYVTPGIVDMHSHVGADSFPTTRGTSDVNEMSSQTNPQNRIIDSINILDEGIDVVASGGVTTSLVLPGSGTLIGGEAVAIKLIKPANYEVQDMTVNRNVDETIDGKIWRWMKMACGENPKHRNNPSSRMGSGWLYRKRFEEARTTLRAQDDWCVAAKVAEARFGGDAHQYITERFPDPIVQDSLVGLLRGDVRVNIHCYETHDIEMMIRNKHEFGFQIGAFHHALEAHLVAPLLARENISVALFADHSLYKKEAYGASVKAGKILHEAGVKVAYKSDHPVLNAQHLIFEAQKAAHYGLDPDAAFASVTSVPAERLGLGWRIGTLAVGYDADVLVWDRHPLELGAAPLKVIIDGFLIQAGNRKMRAKPEAVAPSTPPMTFETNVDVLDRQPYTITNISKVFSDDGEIKKGSITVEKGVVTCIGNCREKGTLYNLNGGVVIPGLVGANLDLGLTEIPPESTTNDGESSSAEAIAGNVRAVDGIRVGGNSKTLNEAFRGGVLTSISVPSTDGFVKGLSAAFRTGAETYSTAILKSVVALHVSIGQSGVSTATPSGSSQIAKLRSLFTHNATGPFHEAFTGKLPLVVNAEDPNDISKILAMKRELVPDLRLIIAGASGAWVVANELAELNVPVLLTPARCVPSQWETRWCRIPATRPSAVELLIKAGVKVLVSQNESGVKRNLLWEAGWVYADSDEVSENDAVGSVTWNVAKAFGVEGVGVVREGKRASFVGLNGGPLGFGRNVQIIGDGVDVVVRPEQD